MDRVVVFCHNFELNGANRFVLDLVRGLSNQYQFTLVSPFSGYLQTKCESFGFAARVVPHDKVPEFLDSAIMRQRPRVMVNTLMQSPTVLQLHSNGFEPLWVVHESWDLDTLEYTLKHIWSLTSPTTSQILTAIKRTKNLVFPASSALQRYSSVMQDKGTVIYNGLNQQNYPKSHLSQSDLKSKLGLRADVTLLTQVGTVCPRKNQMASIKALKILNDGKSGHFHLLLAGARTFRKHEALYISELNEYIGKHGLENLVTILPTTESIGEIYQASDILLCPSLNEALPYVIVEAMHYDLPVIASGVDGIPEAVDNRSNGLLIDPENPQQIADACLEIANDRSLRSSLISNGQIKIQEQFSYPKMLERYSKLLRSTAHDNGTSESKVRQFRFKASDLLISKGSTLLGRNVLSKLDTLLANEELINEARQSKLTDDLYRATSHAKANVPYYKDLFRKIAFDPESLKTDIKFIEDVPYLTRELIKSEGARLIDDRLTPAQLNRRYSNSQSDDSLVSYYSQDDLDWTAATNLFLQNSFGRTGDRKQLIVRAGEIAGTGSSIQEKLKAFFFNRTVMRLADYSDNELRRLRDKILRVMPFSLNAPPSLLLALINLSKSDEISLQATVGVVESVNETLPPALADKISGAFGCRVFNRYSLSEAGIIAFGEHSSLRSIPDLSYIEFNKVQSVSDFSEIVLTTLHRDAMPLIRYRTGDYAKDIISKNFELTFTLDNDSYKLENGPAELVKIGSWLKKQGNVSDYQISSASDEVAIRILQNEGASCLTPQSNYLIKSVDSYQDFTFFGRGKRFNRINV